jgi:hypothetical protein
MKSTKLIAVAIFQMFALNCLCQTNLKQALTTLNSIENSPISTITSTTESPFHSGIKQLISDWNAEKINRSKNTILSHNSAKNGDTLYIGEVANDSVVVSGTWIHEGPIFIIGDGKLVFNNANATILGDIWIWGNSAKLISNNSTLYIPQQYFYQRTLLAAGNGQFIFNDTHLDFSGMSHNFVATDSAQFIQKNVTKNGFTTNGLSKKAQMHLENTNLGGEFICTDEIKVTFKKTKTILLWHHIPNGAVLTHSFPTPDTVATYRFSNLLPGVQNINYTIEVDTCTDVMWALMPASGSTTTLSNSNLRAVGVWFEAPGNISVSGLVNNSTYSDFTPGMSDKTLRLINSSVKTWNLYTFKENNLTLSGSIVGEIGSMGKSRVTCQSSMVDGSGGYTWATDTTMLIAGFSSLTNDFRATRNGIALMAYSTLQNGVAMATDNGILIVNQSSLPEFPLALDNSCVWFNKIEHPSSGYQNNIVSIYGSSYIEKTATSPHMDFAWYQLFYQMNTDTIWTSITEKIQTSVKDNILAQWNTTGLAPNNYNIKLVLCDNTPDSNKVEAIKSINILPEILSVENIDPNNPQIQYQNNIHSIVVDQKAMGEKLLIYDAMGRIVYLGIISETTIPISHLSAGMYLAKFEHNKQIHPLKFILLR